LKDNNPVYSPGNSQESSLLSLNLDHSKEIQKNTMVKITTTITEIFT